MKRMFDENEIRQIASEAGGGEKLYLHGVRIIDQRDNTGIAMFFYTYSNVAFTPSAFKDYFRNNYSVGITGTGHHENNHYPSYAYVDIYGGPSHDDDVITYYAKANSAGEEKTLVLSEFEMYANLIDTVTEV